jgi:hypothetical protein
MADLNAVLAEARACMDAHGLQDWNLATEVNIDDVGRTFQQEKLIVLSRPYVKEMTMEENRVNYLHEIGHAMVNLKYGPERAHRINHGRAWVEAEHELGVAHPQAMAIGIPLPVPAKYMKDPKHPDTTDLNEAGEDHYMNQEFKTQMLGELNQPEYYEREEDEQHAAA